MSDYSNSLATAEPILDADGKIAEKLSCARCGAYLVGSQPAEFCPECHTPVADSIQSTRLCFSNYGWLVGISRGFTLIIAGAILSVVNIVFGSGILLLLQQILWATVGPIVLLYGVWQVTAPEPRDDVLPALEQARTRLRAAALATIPLFLVRFAETFTTLEFGYIGNIAAVVLLVFSVPYAREIARRIPDPRIEKAFTIAASGLATMFVVALLPALPIDVDDPQLLLLMATTILVVVAGLSVWLLVVLVQYRKRLSLAIDVAQERYMRQLTK